MVRRSGQQGVPVITIDDEVVVGFDRPRLERILAVKGAVAAGSAGGPASQNAGGPSAGSASEPSATEPPPRPRVVFGAAIADASRILMQQGRVPVFGAYVGKVASSSPAHRAGLQPGDIITECNLRPITNADSFEQSLAALDPGGIVRLTVTRGDRTYHTETRV